MKITVLSHIPVWFTIVVFTTIPTNSSEARRFQTYTSTEHSAFDQENFLTPIIKVEEYRYLEKKLVQKNLDYSLLDLFFGRNEYIESTNSTSSTTSRTNRLLLPQMVGGLSTLFEHIEYPNQAKAKGIEGMVTVEFTVTELGMVNDIVIIEGLGAGCDEEVINALKKTRFSPAVQNGRFVKVKLSQSILFELKPLKE